MKLHPPHPSAATLPETDEDEREFEAFARTQDPVDLAAATWALRRRSGLDPAGASELLAWLAADPRHADALEDMACIFPDLHQIPDDERPGLEDAPLGTQAPGRTLTPPRNPLRPPGWWPRAGLAAGILALCCAAWMGWQRWQQLPLFEQAYGTGRGQQLNLVLPDAPQAGTAVQLDSATRAEVRLFRDRREVRLGDGQAMFVVHADAKRPFHVWAGGVRITVVGTRFSVRHSLHGRDAGRTVVEVEEGKVRVAPALSGGTPALVELKAGQRVCADRLGSLSPVEPLAPGAVAPWREGRLSFDQTPLAEAIAEFERYGPTGLVVRDPAVAALRVGGSFALGRHRQFAEALPHLLPVRLERRGELTEVVRRAH